MAELRKCPFCGGEAELIEYIETVDGRGDKIARVRCKCGCEIHLTMREFSQAEDDFGYKGGYYSQNKKFWNGMHQRLVDKWNNRATESEIREKAIEEFAEKLKAELIDALRIFSERREMYEIESDMGKMYSHGIGTLKGVNHMVDEIAEQLKGE